MDFGLLGPVEAWDARGLIDIGHARQRCVLAVLAVEAGSPVSVDALLDRVWGTDVPQRGRNVVYGYVSRLKSVLASATAATPIVRRSNGYVLAVEQQDVDVYRFRRLVDRARRTDGDQRRLALLDAALRLWRGTAFAGLDTEWINGVRVSLHAERREAEAERTDVALRLGMHAAVLGDLAARATQHPLDERVAGQLMVAMYRCGRQGDALEEYRRIHGRLVDELGAAPGRPLQELHQRVLAADPALLTAPAPAHSPTAPPPARALPVPRQLPASPMAFVGRNDELASLTTALGTVAPPGRALVITALAGVGGVGKTWLGLYWAHRNLDRFPDGQLFVDLQGFSPTQQPLPPTVVLRGFLHALGVEPSQVPSDLYAQTALYRSLTADRRMLVMLDNAADSDQVVPLLPGGAGCTVLITSRRHLAGLVTRHGAGQLRLGVLTAHEARDLLVTWLGVERCNEEPEATEEILRRCAGLPLALSIVASRARLSPETALADMAAELRDSRQLMETLHDEDPSASLPAVLSWSVRALTPERSRVFGLLGVAPGPDIAIAAATSLTGLPPDRTRSVLRALERASLVERDAAGRYRMHDLVRLAAWEHARRSIDEATRHEAVRRLIDFYTHTVAVAGHLLEPDDVLLAARAGLAAAYRLDDPVVLLRLHRLLATALVRTDSVDEALPHLKESLRLSEQIDDPAQQAAAHNCLIIAHGQRREFEMALEHAETALHLSRTLDSPIHEARALNAVGWCRAQLKDYAAARTTCEAALDILRRHNNPHAEASVLDSLGFIAHQAGDPAEALVRYRAALDLRRAGGHGYQVADTLERLGDLHGSQQQSAQAHTAWRGALELYREQGRASDAARVEQLLED